MGYSNKPHNTKLQRSYQIVQRQTVGRLRRVQPKTENVPSDILKSKNSELFND